jgi:hypothetical protein
VTKHPILWSAGLTLAAFFVFAWRPDGCIDYSNIVVGFAVVVLASGFLVARGIARGAAWLKARKP